MSKRIRSHEQAPGGYWVVVEVENAYTDGTSRCRSGGRFGHRSTHQGERMSKQRLLAGSPSTTARANRCGIYLNREEDRPAGREPARATLYRALRSVVDGMSALRACLLFVSFHRQECTP
jgi:hypothetical protein